MATDVIEFIQKELTSSFYDAPKENIDFTILKDGEVSSGKKYLKFSAQFRYGKHTFFSTYYLLSTFNKSKIFCLNITLQES